MIAGANRMRSPQRLGRWIRELGLEGDTLELGWVEEASLAPLYRGAEAGVYVSRHEGFGLPPLECLACGTPVVVGAGLALDEEWPDYPFRCRDLSSWASGMPSALRWRRMGGVATWRSRRGGCWITSIGRSARALLVAELRNGGRAMISVIIVNHNGEEHLRRCLESLRGPGPELEILVVDNASSDGSLGMVREIFPEVRVLEQDRNLGFGAANNLAAIEARGESLLLLNADAWLEAGALQRLHERMQREDRLALVAPALFYPDGRRQFVWSPERGVAGEALQQLRNPFENRRWAHGAAMRQSSRLVGRLWFTAACVLVRREAFEAVGGFDETFFMYFEDVDLCVRLEKAGWGLAQEPGAVVHHAGGFARHPHVDDVYRPSQLRYYALHRPRWEARLVERRLRRRYGDAAVDGWLQKDGAP